MAKNGSLSGSSGPRSQPLSTLQESLSGTDLAGLAGRNGSDSKNTSGRPSYKGHTPSLSHSVSGTASRPASVASGHPRRVSEEHFGLSGQNGARNTIDTRPAEASDPNALLRVQHGIVKSRSGSVLGRGFILKNDRLPPRSTHSLDFRLKGAPNFRSGGEGIYGSAQPSITGLRTVLATLGCHPGGQGRTVWICTREEPVIYIGGSPFVLRDAEEPLKNYSLSERPEALESVEKRLKQDILRESGRYGGVVQVQEEVDDRTNKTGMSSTWIAATSSNVMTLRELWQNLQTEGYRVEYQRIAISSDENPENRYLDSFLAVLRDIDPNVSLYFNCGVGVVRTTLAMTLALLVRRRQTKLATSQNPSDKAAALRRESVVDRDVQRNLMAEAAAIAKRNRTLLRLTTVLNTCVTSGNQHSLLELLLSQPRLLENLRLAVNGEYDIVLNLLSCLDNGEASKALADEAIDHCEAVVNLREMVLNHRVNLALAAMDDSNRTYHLQKALAGLERYFFLVAFASFISSSDGKPDMKYSDWLKGRPELRNMAQRLRASRTAAAIFAPVADLSAMSRGPQLGNATPLAHSRFSDVLREGAEVIGDEFVAQIVRRRKGITLRGGMILKKDIWHDAVEDGQESKAVRGALNFRKIDGTDVYALSQPTDIGITGVLDSIAKDRHNSEDRVTWVNLREEPLCYINGAPYVLREESLSLRNLKSYAGISASRLELIEDRLKRDVLAELQAGDGRILLHSERSDGTVVAVWESVEPNNVATLREVMESLIAKRHFSFKRIPITAEGPPNFADIAEIVEVVSLSPLGHSVVVNCQLGRGRSTLVSIMLTLFRRWLEAGGKTRAFAEAPSNPPRVLAYAVINNLIRVIRNGREIKMHVDSAIQQCSEIYSLLDAIEESRQEAEEASDEKRKTASVHRGTADMRRYFVLVLFAAWLNESSADSLQSLREEHSFEKYVKERPVYHTILGEIEAAGANALTPLGNSSLGTGVASDEVEAIVAGRTGRILSTSTILKSDFFSNLQKLSLPDRVEGAPNYRRTPLYVESQSGDNDEEARALRSIYGTGMPSKDGLRRALDKMGAGKEGNSWVYWTLMREEPVIFVRGRPHVLRLLALPLENVVTTGVTAESVEGQESALKSDVLREVQKHKGRLLLHDETDDGNGHFTLTAQWEDDISEEDILTPSDVYRQMVEEGYRVDYARLPVTDEQAPIPRVFAHLEDRVAAALERKDVAMAFNCQMGRGRTTSAMVAAALVATILHPDELSKTPANEAYPTSAAPDGAFEIREIEDPYLNGEYKIIFQLLSVLQYGKLAKQLTDKAIDQCEAVQNLRKAVLTYKLQWESAEAGSSKKEKVGNLAFNYLYRYGTLIAFANYLLEKRDAQGGAMSSSFSTLDQDTSSNDFPTFPEYLKRKSEINSVLSRRTLD